MGTHQKWVLIAVFRCSDTFETNVYVHITSKRQQSFHAGTKIEKHGKSNRKNTDNMLRTSTANNEILMGNQNFYSVVIMSCIGKTTTTFTEEIEINEKRVPFPNNILFLNLKINFVCFNF